MKHRKHDFPWGTSAAVAVAAAILSYQLLCPPVVGLANNGDFEKIMGLVGLKYPPELSESQKYFRFASSRFLFAEPNWWRSEYHTSETLLVRLAIALARLGRSRAFDIRWMALVHSAVFLFFFGWLLRSLERVSRTAWWTAAIAGVAIFTDVGYVAPMNTLYGQTASYLFLFGIFAVLANAAARGRFDVRLGAAFFILSALFLTSKPQEAVQGLLLAGFALWAMLPNAGRARAAVVAGAAGLLVLSIWYFAHITARMRGESIRKALFQELLVHSPTPESDLRDIGFRGKSAVEVAADADLQRKFLAGTGRGILLKFYLTHPERTVHRAVRTARAAMVLRPRFFGDLAESAGAPPRATSRAFSVWSSLRARLRPIGPVVLLVLFGGSAAIAVMHVGKAAGARLAPQAVLLIVALGALDFAVCGFAGSHIEIERHLFAFDAITDALLVLAVLVAAQRVAGAFARGRAGRALVDRNASIDPRGDRSREGSIERRTRMIGDPG